MQTANTTTITVTTTVLSPVEKVWEVWTDPQHIMQWCAASEDWHAPHAANDLQEGGKFSTTMAAKDGSMQFDFSGMYTRVEKHKAIEYTLDDGRKVWIRFKPAGETTEVEETFEPENSNSLEMQQFGWQAIMDNFRKYCESQS